MQRSRRNPAARVTFFVQRDRILSALQRGDTLTQVHADLGYKGSYSQLARYVAAYLPAARLKPDRPAAQFPKLAPARAAAPKQRASGGLRNRQLSCTPCPAARRPCGNAPGAASRGRWT